MLKIQISEGIDGFRPFRMTLCISTQEEFDSLQTIFIKAKHSSSTGGEDWKTADRLACSLAQRKSTD